MEAETRFTEHGKSKPAFTVTVEPAGGGGSVEEELMEEIEGSTAVERLERELRWVTENIDELVHGTVVGRWSYSKYALYALVLLAAARANVNPVLIKFVYKSNRSETASFHDMIYGLTASVFYARYNAISRFVKQIERLQPHIAIYETWRALDMLIQLVDSVGDEPDERTRLLLAYLLDSLSSEVKAFIHDVYINLGYEKVADIYRRAAGEARDPDVKRLAEILAELTDKAVKMAETLGHYLVFPLQLLDELPSPERFKARKREVLERLKIARDFVREIEREVSQLISEVRDIDWRLGERGLVLDMEMETEEDIKRRLLEA